MARFLAMQVRMGAVTLEQLPELYRNAVAELVEED